MTKTPFRLAAGAPASSLLTGLVSYWTLNETTGTRVDSGGNGYDLTDINSVPYGVGAVHSNAALFDMTVDQWLTRARASVPLLNFGPSDAFTLAVWVYPTAFTGSADTPAYYRTMFSLNGGHYTSGGYWLFTTNGGQMVLDLGSTSGPGNSILWHTALYCSLDQWQLVIASYDGPSGDIVARIGASEATTNNANKATFTAATSGAFFIGARGDSLDHIYDGRIGPAMAWSRVLTSDEMTTLRDGTPYPFS